MFWRRRRRRKKKNYFCWKIFRYLFFLNFLIIFKMLTFFFLIFNLSPSFLPSFLPPLNFLSLSLFLTVSFPEKKKIYISSKQGKMHLNNLRLLLSYLIYGKISRTAGTFSPLFSKCPFAASLFSSPTPSLLSSRALSLDKRIILFFICKK